jgi:hypothetical protein
MENVRFVHLIGTGVDGYVIWDLPIDQALSVLFSKLGYYGPPELNPAEFWLDLVSGRITPKCHLKDEARY